MSSPRVEIDVTPLVELGVIVVTRILTAISKATLELDSARREGRPLDAAQIRPLLEQLDARDHLLADEARSILAELRAEAAQKRDEHETERETG